MFVFVGKNMIKILNKIKIMLQMLLEFRPVTRRTLYNQTTMILTILGGQREMGLMNRQELVVLASKIIKFHGADMKKDENVPVPPDLKPMENKNNMYG